MLARGGEVVAYSLSSNELNTTETDDRDMAMPAIHGSRDMPRGEKTPAASGMPTRLYITAHKKLNFILRTVLLDS